MIIAVTSNNRIKVNAVVNAYLSIGIPFEITGYSTDSGIGEQPVEDQTLLGAQNRISNLRSRVNGLDRIVSIESGIFFEKGKWIDRAVAVIYRTDNNNEQVLYSKGVVFPTIYVDRARTIGFDKITVGKVMQKAGYVTDDKDPHLTISGISRQYYIEQVLKKLVRQVESGND
jgi:non-canonical (house-cleaning) NTP pyrophosphatase